MIEENLNWQSHCIDIIKDYSFFFIWTTTRCKVLGKPLSSPEKVL